MRILPTRKRSLGWQLWLGVGLVLFGAYAWVIGLFGCAMPWWDQWDSEAALTYLPLARGELQLLDLWHPHGEHRIVVTKVIGISVLKAAGVWDANVQTLVNAALLALFAGFLARWIWNDFSPRVRLWVMPLAMALFALPYGHENVIGAFQNQIYLLTIFSVFVARGIFVFKPWSVGGVLTLLCAFVLLGTMASGAMVAFAALPVLAWRFLLKRNWRQSALIYGTSLLVQGAAGLVSLFFSVQNDALATRDWGVFFLVLIKAASWPVFDALWPALLLALPWFWLVVRILRERRAPSSKESWTLTLGLWGLLHMVAIASVRGGAGVVAYRYSHILVVWVLANVVSLGLLFERAGTRRAPVLRLVLTARLALMLVAMPYALNVELRGEYARVRDERRIGAENVLAYLKTHDASALDGFIPYPLKARLRQCLDQPEIARILPDGTAFASRAALRVAHLGPVVFGLGLFLFGWGYCLVILPKREPRMTEAPPLPPSE